MIDDLVLFAVAADSSTEMWDGTKPAEGIMLRWVQRNGLDFPEWGYTVERAPVPEPRPLDWNDRIDQIRGLRSYAFNADVTMVCDEPFSFQAIGGRFALMVPKKADLRFVFAKPFWWGIVQSANLGDMAVDLRVNSTTRTSDLLMSGSRREWRVRGANELLVRGGGALDSVLYQLLDVPRKWVKLAHICLPVVHPGYPCGPLTGSSESIAKSRVPVDVDWNSRYSAGFAELDPMLRAAATKSTSSTSFATTTSSTTQQPSIQMNPLQAISFATLDPHLARTVGVLYDDPLTSFGLDGRAWAYRVTGTWQGAGTTVFPTKLEPADAFKKAGIVLFSLDARAKINTTRKGDVVTISSTRGARLEFRRPVRSVEIVGRLDATISSTVTWTATGRNSSTTRTWSATKRNSILTAAIADGELMETLELTGPFQIVVDSLELFTKSVERFALLPWVEAKVGVMPRSPSWMTAEIATPAGGGGDTQAALRWDPDSGADSFTGGTVLYQLAAKTLSSDPTVQQPTAPPFDARDLLFNGAPLTLPRGARNTPPPPYALDRPLTEGWRAWWVRGIDLFGRVSAASPPVMQAIVDDQPGPPPRMLRAEWAQAGLDVTIASTIGQSTAAVTWLNANPTTSAVVCEWAWTPELDTQCDDVDAFRLYVRRRGADGTWTHQPWGTAIASLGPIPVRYEGAIVSVDTTLANTTLTSVVVIDSNSSGCQTTLQLDIAGALIGANLRIGAQNYPILAHSEGANVRLVVANPAGMPPAGGPASIEQGASIYVRMGTTIIPTALSSNPHRVRIAGALRVGDNSFMVAAIDGGDFIARRILDPNTGNPIGSLPEVGNAVTWYPYYRFVVADSGFGPVTSTNVPAADAEVTVTSVRRIAFRPAESTPASPAIIHAVDATPPPAPTVPSVPSGLNCAQLATAADWYGKSRYRYSWNPVANVQGYVVHRAMHDAVRLADQSLHLNGGVVTAHSFANAQLPNDLTRRASVLADLADLDAALQLGGNEAIVKAYNALRSDTWQVLASQASVASAFTALHGAPLSSTTTSYEDTFDGRIGAHWFYRVLAISNGGVRGPLSPSTPPICAPKVTAPEPPRALQALAGTNSVQLRFARSPSVDIARYRVYRIHDPDRAKDTSTMYVQVTLAPTTTGTPLPGEVLPIAAGNALTWTDTNATGGREWYYRILAEDTDGNASTPTDLLTARSLAPVPVPPLWNQAIRTPTSIELSWTHPDPRIAAQVERRRTGTVAPWVAVTGGWLPRGVMSFSDETADEHPWQYRLRVRDRFDQLCPTFPVINVT